MATDKSETWGVNTRLAHSGHTPSDYFGFVNPPVVHAATVLFPDAATMANRSPKYVYGTRGTPTTDALATAIDALEGSAGTNIVPSGLAAVTVPLLAFLAAGDHVLIVDSVYRPTRHFADTMLARLGIQVEYYDPQVGAGIASLMRPNTKVVFIETPTNPTLELVDIRAVADIAHAHGARLIVDNVFATALYQKPLELGADLVTYSATKHIDGQGRVLGGIVLGSKALIEGDIHTFLRQTGATLSAFNAWVLLKGLETYELRIRQMTDSAEKVAQALAGHPKVNRVLYPHHPSHPQYELAKRQMQRGSTLIAIDVKGGQEGAFTLSDSLAVILISNNLGDAKSLITHPRTTTHARFTEDVRLQTGVTPGLLRLSVGLEASDDLIADLMYGLDQVRA